MFNGLEVTGEEELYFCDMNQETKNHNEGNNRWNKDKKNKKMETEE